MQIALLGPFEVQLDGGAVEVAGARLRRLLACLALDAGRPVGTGALAAAVWDERPPAEPANALQTLVSRLRRSLGDAGAVVAAPAGYRLAVAAEQVDALRFERLADTGRAALHRGDVDEAVELLGEALALWRGPLDPDTVPGDRAARLEDRRLAARTDHAAALLAAGRPDVAAVEALADEQPLDERVAALQLTTLAAVGRQAEALASYERLRARLADELGVDPSAEVQQAHLAVLRGEVSGAAPETPPARAARPTRRTNLKAQLTSFVGRADEVARVAGTLEAHRLVTVVGPGGAGKTRLAAETAAGLVDGIPDGVWFCELAGVSSGDDVVSAVLGSLGLREVHLLERRTGPPPRDAFDRLLEGLAAQQALVVLDNCEHLLDACAELAERLLGECPQLRVLATSREPLGIVGEAVLAVPPLGVPAPDAPPVDALRFPAVQLFADRAAAAQTGFCVDVDTVGPVVEIVRRLDGLPLAIELAAARLRALPLTDIASRLDDRFRLLTGGSRTALPRHRTLRAVVEWSWDLLSEPERRLAEQLAVFAAGITTDSAVAVRPDGVTEGDVADLLAALVDKSLLQPIGDGRRLRMLETIREYGLDRLAARDELAAARARHAAHFTALLHEAAGWLTTVDQLPWFRLLAAERENVAAALREHCAAGDADEARLMAVELSWWAMMLGEHSDIPVWADTALDVPGGTDDGLELACRALSTVNLVLDGGGPAQSRRTELLDELLDRLDQAGPDAAPGMALLRPVVAFLAERPELAERFAVEAMDSTDEWTRATMHILFASMAENRGDVELLRREARTALALFDELGERWGRASALRLIAVVSTLDGDLAGAGRAYRDSVRLLQDLTSNDDQVFALVKLVDLELRGGAVAAADEIVQQARRHADETGATSDAVLALSAAVDVARYRGEFARARELADEAESRIATLPDSHPIVGHLRAGVFNAQALVALGEGDVEAADIAAAAAFRAAVRTQDLPIVAMTGVVRAGVLARQGDPAGAAAALGAAATVRGAEDPSALEVSALTIELTATLGADGFAAAYAQGRALPPDEARARLDPDVSGAAVVGA